ncbi:MAG TPA: chemotaxis protein CheA [Gemmatimonadaceae bacterium]|nr:chemotaxis protein CheA [Gemmatimonadaceae bacterium]
MDLSRYAELFLTESREHLSAMNHALLALESSPEASEPVGAIFRAVHTVKGMSATMGYRAVTDLAHELESVLDRVRRGELAVTADVTELLFEAADALEQAIEGAVQTGVAAADDIAVPDAILDLIARLKARSAAATGGSAPKQVVAPSRAPDPRPSQAATSSRLIRLRLASGTALRGARALLLVKRAASLGTVLEVIPPVEALQAEEFGAGFSIHLNCTAPRDEIVRAMFAVGDVDRVEVDGVETVGQPHQQTAADGQAGSAARPTRQVRIDLQRLDTLMNMIGELVIARGRLLDLAARHGDPALDEAVALAARLIGEMQDEVMLSRMVPVGQVFDRFPRLVRDAAHGLGKQIVFTVEGNDIELDRSMLDEIGDPVVHLLRNAVDHGIETPEQRRAAGKPASGSLVLSVSRERSTVLVRVEDDGKGIDRERVLARAKELSFVDKDKASLSDEELMRIIARPGFSTAERVTDLSGRGVGIDVVMNRVRAMGGAVEMRSVPGRGTAVTVRLPHTLAIVRALLARVRDEVYAVPLAHVNETVELDARSVRRVQGREVMLLRDDVLPLIRFDELLRLGASGAGARHQVIVLEVGERRAGLVVDELTGQQDIVVKQFDPARESLALFSGATILGDGAPALIVDVGSLL